jgi:hypothetical protein
MLVILLHFDYCSEVWDTLGVGLSSRLQKLQNRVARVIMNLRYNTPGIEAINALGWEPLERLDEPNVKLNKCTKF